MFIEAWITLAMAVACEMDNKMWYRHTVGCSLVVKYNRWYIYKYSNRERPEKSCRVKTMKG